MKGMISHSLTGTRRFTSPERSGTSTPTALRKSMAYCVAASECHPECCVKRNSAKRWHRAETCAWFEKGLEWETRQILPIFSAPKVPVVQWFAEKPCFIGC